MKPQEEIEMRIKLLTTAVALTLATAMAPVFAQQGGKASAADPVTNAEKSKVVKDAPGKVPSLPKSTKAGSGGEPDPVTTAEKSKAGKETAGVSAKPGEKGKATDPVTNAEKSKVVK